MSDSNRLRVSIVAETTFNETPASPAFHVLPTTGMSLRDRIGYQQSQTINNDRNINDLVRLSKAAGGGLPCELTYSYAANPNEEALQRAIQAILCATETAASTATGSPAVNSGTTTITKTGNWADENFEVGDIVKISGAATAAHNGYRKVTAVSTVTLTTEGDNFTADEAVTVTRGARMTNGTEQPSYSIEVARLDLQIAQVFTGCVFNGMDFNVADEAITTCSFSIEAAGSTFITSNTGTTDQFIASATYTDPATNPVLDSIGVPTIQSGGSAYAAKSIAMSFNNNASPRTQIGSLGAQSMRWGEFSASGTITAYLEDFTELQAYANNTETDIWLVLEDSNSKGYSVSFPRVKFGDAGADVGGTNQDVLVQLSATALKDSTEGITVRWQRWD